MPITFEFRIFDKHTKTDVSLWVCKGAAASRRCCGLLYKRDVFTVEAQDVYDKYQGLPRIAWGEYSYPWYFINVVQTMMLVEGRFNHDG